MELTTAALWLNQTFAGFDRWLIGVLHTLQQGPAGSFFDQLAMLFHHFGAGGVGFIVLGALLVILPKTRRTGAAILLALLLGLLLTNLTIKPLVARPRPYADETGPFFALWRAAGGLVESVRSFPSGHTTAAMGAMTVIFWSYDKRYSWAAFLVALLMALSRVYLVVHYPSDVVGGLLMGFVAGSIAFFAMRAIWRAVKQRRNKHESI